MEDTRHTRTLFKMPIQQTNQKAESIIQDQRVHSVGALRRHNGRDRGDILLFLAGIEV